MSGLTREQMLWGGALILAVVLILIIVVQALQSGGEALARRLDKRHPGS